jgi:hypothetical protein
VVRSTHSCQRALLRQRWQHTRLLLPDWLLLHRHRETVEHNRSAAVLWLPRFASAGSGV